MMDSRTIKKALETFTIIVDSREHITKKLEERLNAMECPYVQRALRYGDYSARVTLPDGGEFSLERAVCVERKMNFSELCSCYSKQRDRFTREFERAKEDNAKLCLLVECATWEKAYKGDYRSQMTSTALVASMMTWVSRDNCQIFLCQAATSGKIIKDILYREMKERLKRVEDLP